MKKSIRNIVIFGLVTFGCGFIGNGINTLYHPDDPMQSLGVLIWLISPLAANLLLRSLGGDGWKDFGLAPNLLKGWPWYLASVLIVPTITLVVVALRGLSGAAGNPRFPTIELSPFLSLLSIGFLGSMVKNLFEEFAWRGYFTPRLEALNQNPIINSIITGVIWASWHIPYYLYFLSPAVSKGQTALSIPTVILMAFILLPIQAFAYGELRLVSKTVWTTWLLHTLANAISFALLTGGFVPLSSNFSSTLLSPGTEGIIYSLLMALIGWGLHQYRMRLSKAGRHEIQA